ncbi:MAG: helix-turn-helix domain-containing protein [Acidimicrobiia bacterium]|nr:helix-turn-helix domain-containing protein [Acidimicrobiia bacterium]MDH4306635.1 helix-turn-helix domain-containing protein [Acidimicrobiia bacterium]
MSNQISAESSRLDRSIGDLTAALGDPTRRAIFIAVRESPEPMTSAGIADLFGIHPNVARHHLDRLASDGYLQVSHRRPAGRSGPGAGRPAKCYEATTKPIDLHFPSRSAHLLVDLLVRLVDRVAPDDIAGIAESVGREYGRELAAEVGTPDEEGYAAAIAAVAQAMSGLGFGMAPEENGEVQRLLTSHCPFGDAAVGHPDVVCSLDRGIVSGLFETMGERCAPVLHPHTDPIEACVTEVTISVGKR